MTSLVALVLLAPFAQIGHRLLGEQSWRRQRECVARMQRVIDRLDAQLPRFSAHWSVGHSAEMVQLEMALGGIVAMVYLDLAVDRVPPHPRKPTGPWKPESSKVFSFSQRRNGAEQGAWIAYSDILSDEEGNLFEAIVKPALDDCVATFDPMYRVARWTPNNNRIFFQLLPKF